MTRDRENNQSRPPDVMAANADDRIKRIYCSLDLGFSDGYPGENVRELTLKDKLGTIEDAVALLQAEEAIQYSLFVTLGDKHPSPQIYALDFPSDLRASLYLLLGGYYRQAIYCLRSWFEMRILGIYYSCVEQDRSRYEAWKAETEEAPFGTILIGRLFARSEFQKADTQVDLRNRLRGVYGDLCAFTHGGGVERYNLQASTDNVPRYNPASVDLGYTLMKRTFAEMILCLSVAYGMQVFEHVDPEERAVIFGHLPSKYAQMVSQRA